MISSFDLMLHESYFLKCQLAVCLSVFIGGRLLRYYCLFFVDNFVTNGIISELMEKINQLNESLSERIRTLESKLIGWTFIDYVIPPQSPGY